MKTFARIIPLAGLVMLVASLTGCPLCLDDDCYEDCYNDDCYYDECYDEFCDDSGCFWCDCDGCYPSYPSCYEDWDCYYGEICDQRR